MKVRKGYNYENELTVYRCACGSSDHSVLISTFSNDEEALWCQPVFLNEGWWDRVRCFLRYVFLGEEWILGTWIFDDKDHKSLLKRIDRHLKAHKLRC
jgi:hypothetical protein